MKIKHKLPLIVVTFAFGFAPALAIAAHPGGKPGPNGKAVGHSHASQPSSTASGQSNAKAFGKLCQAESKKHVAGQKGTPFSQCVTAMAKLAKNKSMAPGQACKGLSKKHVAGMKGTPFSQCVVAAAHLRGKNKGGTTTTPTTTTPTPTTSTTTTPATSG